MLLDADGRDIERVKQYGFLRGPVEFRLAEPPAAPADIELVDAIGSYAEFPQQDEEEGIPT